MELIEEEGMTKLIKEIKKLEPLKGYDRTLAFIMKNQDQDLLAHISPHVDNEEFTPKDY